MAVLPPDPVDDLEAGPAETWRPGQHHLTKMERWAAWMVSAGLPEEKAHAWAFQLWKIGQKVDTRT